MIPTTYQKPEIRDANDNIIQQGAFGKNTALANATNDGWIDYVANDLNFLYGLAKDEVVPVSALPASGDTNKTYLLITNGKTYRWSGTEWIELTNSEAVGRAENAATLAEQWATKTDGAVADNEYSAKHYSNVSKDWANKLNATVDGSEYSAKHYAGVAEGWAEDAEGTAEDIADHLAQIDQNTGGISANSKRIANIEKLLQGNLYDYQTDSDSAYTKSVPAGAMPYAGVEKIGGKTIVWNQLVSALTNDNWTGADPNVTTREYTDGVCKVTLLANQDWQSGIRLVENKRYNIISGHKYFCSVQTKSSDLNLLAYFGNNSSLPSQSITSDGNWITTKFIATASASGDNSLCGIRPAVGEYGIGYIYYVQKPMVIDLTLMFGVGNEPSTVAEFEAMFADYYEFNAGELLSAGVTEVVSEGVNLVNPANFNSAVTYSDEVINTNFYAYFGDLYTNSTGASAAVDSSYFSKLPVLNAGSYCVEVESGSVEVYTVDSNGTVTDLTNNVTSRKNFTINSRTMITIRTRSTGAAQIKKLRIVKGTNSVPFTPYHKNTYPIPAEVQALEGYGWSAGSVSNYIDFERKVFVQNVGSRAYASGDESDSTVVTDGTTTYYPLTTAVETDISEYLTDDNLIQVEAGGTLTFPNSNGDDYRLPVPSEETYMIDLQSALGGE